GGMKMPGRIEMRAVVGREIDLLDRPPLAVRQVLRLQAGKERQHARQALLVIDVLDGRMVARRVGRHIVLQRHGDVDQLSRHCARSLLACCCQAWTLNSFAAVRPRMSAFSSSLSEVDAKMWSTG